MQAFAPILRTCSALLLATLVAACGGGGGFKSGEEAAREGDVLVRVVDARQATTPVANASVTVTVGSTTRSGTTAADGTFRFSALPVGSATVQVTRDLFLPFSGTVTVQGASLASVTAALQRRTGQVTAKVKERRFDTNVPNARVETTFEGFTVFGTTNASGEVTLNGVPTGSVPVGTSADGYVSAPQQTVTVAENAAAPVTFILDRVSQPGGGYTPPTDPPPPTNSGQTLVLSLEVVVVDQNGVPINNLTGADFTLRACTPAAGEPSECVRRTSSATFDAPYAPNPATGAPGSFQLVPPPTAVAYAASMLLDQSNSIVTNDPSDARVYASKVFLDSVAAGDQVALGAFAQGSGRRIPGAPAPYYVFADFDDARSVFDDALDSLPNLEGGFTPLYAALQGMAAYTAANPAGVRKAVVVFTDGNDTVCTGNAAAGCRNNMIDAANAGNVDIFTVGLGSEVNTAVLTEISYRTGGIHLVATSPEQMIAIFGSLGNLLSGSITKYRLTWTIQANTTNVFQPGDAVLGTIDVRHGTQTIVLPILYTVPAPPP